MAGNLRNAREIHMTESLLSDWSEYVQPRPRGFPLKCGTPLPNFTGKSQGTKMLRR